MVRVLICITKRMMILDLLFRAFYEVGQIPYHRPYDIQYWVIPSNH